MNTLAMRRQRILMLWLARLALFAYAFQFAAVDHWHKDPNSVVGDLGKTTHSYHCHGDVAGCSDQGGTASALPAQNLILSPSLFASSHQVALELTPEAAYVAGAEEPPRFGL
jgi:hypothetical protein